MYNSYYDQPVDALTCVSVEGVGEGIEGEKREKNPEAVERFNLKDKKREKRQEVTKVREKVEDKDWKRKIEED